MIRPIRTVPLALLAGTLSLAGCSGESSGSFGARLAGPLEGTIRGDAFFCRRPERQDFVIFLHDPGTSSGFTLRREMPALPAPGTYGVARGLSSSEEAPGAFLVDPMLHGLEGGDEYSYRVRGGRVRIISADSARMQGRFEVEMVASDAEPEVDVQSGKVKMLPTATMQVTGQFTAAHAERCPPALER